MRPWPRRQSRWPRGATAMASVNAKNGKLFIDFRWRGKRRRRYTAFQDTPANRNRLEKVVRKIERDIKAGTFEDTRYFRGGAASAYSPNSPSQAPSALVAESRAAPLSSKAIDSVSLESFFATWRDEMAPTCRRTYAKSIDQAFRVHVFPFFGRDKRVGDITKEDILAFRATLAKVRPERKRALSPATVNRTLKILRLMMDEAADRFQFKSPFSKVKLLKERKVHVDPFTLEQVRLILKHVRPDFRAYFTVRMFTGMRTGEAHGLKWKHVDFTRREILIRESFVDGEMEYTKNDGSQREIAMSETVYRALLAQKAVTGHLEYLFANTLGEPLDNRNIVKRVRAPLLRYLELPYRRPYQMRHTAATLWLAAGESPEWIARQMGHTTTEMLFRIYSRYVRNLTRRDGSAFESMLDARLNPDGAGRSENAQAREEVSHAR